MSVVSDSAVLRVLLPMGFCPCLGQLPPLFCLTLRGQLCATQCHLRSYLAVAPQPTGLGSQSPGATCPTRVFVQGTSIFGTQGNCRKDLQELAMGTESLLPSHPFSRCSHQAHRNKLGTDSRWWPLLQLLLHLFLSFTGRTRVMFFISLSYN